MQRQLVACLFALLLTPSAAQAVPIRFAFDFVVESAEGLPPGVAIPVEMTVESSAPDVDPASQQGEFANAVTVDVGGVFMGVLETLRTKEFPSTGQDHWIGTGDFLANPEFDLDSGGFQVIGLVGTGLDRDQPVPWFTDFGQGGATVILHFGDFTSGISASGRIENFRAVPEPSLPGLLAALAVVLRMGRMSGLRGPRSPGHDRSTGDLRLRRPYTPTRCAAGLRSEPTVRGGCQAQ